MKFYSFVIAALLLIHTWPAAAQKTNESFTLSGIVKADDGQPLPGATIYIADLKKGSVADGNGHFRISHIPPGSFVVEVDFTGYRSEVENLLFNKDINLDFTLEVAVTEEKEIVITGSSRATSLKRNPIPIISINKQFLQQNLSTNIIDAIAKAPGVNAVTTGPNVSKPFIRGLGFNRILTMYDGIRQEGQQWGDEHGIEIDENAVEKVEVIKGPASLLYGSDAIAGVINLIPPNPPLQGITTGGLSAAYQTNNNLAEFSGHVESYKNDLSWGIIGAHKMAADFRNPIDGRVYNTGYKESSLYVQTMLHKNWGYSRFGISLYNNLQEIPDGARDSATRKFIKETPDGEQIVSEKELRSYKISDNYQRIQHYRIYNITNFTAGRDRAAIQLGFQRNVRQEFDDPASKEAALYLQLNTLTYDAKYFFHQFGKTNITLGVNGMYQSNVVTHGHEFIIPSYHQLDVGPFAFGKYSSGRFELAGGIRFDTRNFKNEALYVSPLDEEVPVFGKDTIGAQKLFSDYSHLFSGLSGSAGISYRMSKDLSLKFNVARGFRAPNISEISANGIHSGSKIYQLGNENFKPEFSFQQDFGLYYSSEHVSLNFGLFNNTIQNYIYNKKVVTSVGADSIIIPGYQTFKYTASKARLQGGELMIDLHPHPHDWLHFENAISFVVAKNLEALGDEDRYLPFIPPFHTRSELRASFKEVGSHLKNAFAKIALEVYGAQNRVFSLSGTETPTPGYQLVNGGFGFDVENQKGKTLFSVSVLGNNLFNVAYQSNMSRMKYFEDYPDDPRGHHGIYNMGRNISLNLKVPF